MNAKTELEKSIEYLLNSHDNSLKSTMAWLIGRIDSAEQFERQVKKMCGVYPLAETTLECIKRRIIEQEENRKGE